LSLALIQSEKLVVRANWDKSFSASRVLTEGLTP